MRRIAIARIPGTCHLNHWDGIGDIRKVLIELYGDQARYWIIGRRQYDIETDCYLVQVSSEHFEEVHEGERFPYLMWSGIKISSSGRP